MKLGLHRYGIGGHRSGIFGRKLDLAGGEVRFMGDVGVAFCEFDFCVGFSGRLLGGRFCLFAGGSGGGGADGGGGVGGDFGAGFRRGGADRDGTGGG